VSMTVTDVNQLKQVVHNVIEDTAVTDMHTHLYAPVFGDLLLYGPDELITYHYLIAETMRHTALTYDEFWALSKEEMANHIWQTLFLEHSPYSEACRGILTTFHTLGLDLRTRNLDAYREWYGTLSAAEAVDLVFQKANVKEVVMTNDPFDDEEHHLWLTNGEALKQDKRFHAALRIDPLLNDWDNTYKKLRAWEYDVQPDVTQDEQTLSEVTRFLVEWGRRMEAVYMAVSLPIEFQFPVEDTRSALIERCVVVACRELNIPFAMMIGVKRRANPSLQLAGDMGGRADIQAVERMCARFPSNRFFVTMLSRENQHDLAVLARKFPNLMPFGCWWFLNNPSLIEEITTMRFELLGTSVIPQHSDARVLDQLLYKWSHSRKVIEDVLFGKYRDILASGWQIEQQEIERDAADLFGQNFWRFVRGKKV
jgi:hypothetical protein